MINDIDVDDRADRQHFNDIYENMLNVPNPRPRQAQSWSHRIGIPARFSVHDLEILGDE